MENLNIDIKRKILSFLKEKKRGASSSEIAKNIGHNRITVTKYLEIMKAHKLLMYEEIAQAKLWQILEKTSKKKILIVDDEPHIVELVKLSLMKDTRIIVDSYSGIDALDKVSSETPDLIILDLMMPGISGYEVCQKLKQDVITQHIPILILSAKGEIKDKLKGINMGADDYMTKPFDPSELEARVDNLLINCDQELDINPLTELPGKLALINRLTTSVKGFSILKIRLNKIKEFNKEMGFKKGNEVITMIGRMIREKLGRNEEDRAYHLMKDIIVVITKQKDFSKDIQAAFSRMLPFIYDSSKIKNKINLKITALPKTNNINKLMRKIETEQ